MKANEFLDWDEEELEPETEAEVFGQLLRAIANNEGAGCFFVQCSRGQEDSVIERLQSRFGQVLTLQLERDSVSIYPEAMALLEQGSFDVLVVRGLDQALLGYEDAKRALGWDDAALHNYDLRDVPQILHHLNQMRECWYEQLLRPVVFVVPPFVVRYLILRCPDFYDWRVGTFVLPLKDSERQNLEAWARVGEYSKYLQLLPEERIQKASELRELIELPITSINDQSYFLKKQGVLFASNQDIELAISCFKHSLTLKSDDHEAWRKCGYAFHLLDRIEEAVASYDEALRLKPDDYTVWNNRGSGLSSLGRSEEAIASYDKALEINPKYNFSWYNRGDEFSALGRAEEAIASYDKALEINPKDSLAWNNRGVLLANLGQVEEAIASYDKALEINPKDSLAWDNRGNLLISLGRAEEVISSYDKALEINPEDSLAGNSRGVLLFSLGRTEEAITSYDKALEFNPDNYESWCYRGIALWSLKRGEEALTSYDKALEFKPDYQDAWSWRGLTLKDLKRYKEAEFSYRQALAIEVRAFDYTNLGDVLRSQERYDKALASYNKAIALEPDYRYAHYEIGWTYSGFVKPPNYVAAHAAFQACLEYDKNDPEAYYGLACIDSLQNHLDSALEHLQHVFELAPSYRDRARKDKDFDPIRHDPRFQTLINLE